MNPPKLRRSESTEYELPQIQNNYDFLTKVVETDVESLNGTLLTDISYIKNGLVIYYDALTKAQYDGLVAFIKLVIDTPQKMEFMFEKITQYESYVECKARISEATPFVGGSGETDYYVACQLIITEVNAR